ncbi:MFS transporter [Thermoactinomyces daqus]|uniref:MFS transporter n=1 Tax=Thermoactinomyces daqus TaxID=1329516 RepID=A0A7W1X7J4_9BACL|nr:MDR family MFS transporter [Thermoactinomyces daqus]MBA4541551.1 MFS transporter [Thermoactinomyces daqus]
MEHLSSKQKMTIMVAIVASLLFAALNQTIVGNIMPRIIAELKGMEYFQWVFTIYMLTSSITVILVGRLSDNYGRKPFILIGLGIFVIGSLLCGTSSTILELILFRGLQGFGGGMVMSTAFSAVGDLFSPRERGRWQGIMSGSFGLASILGPALGGYIVDHLAWHWCFWIFLPFGIIAFVLIWFLFPSVPRKGPVSIDYLGSLFLMITMIPLLLAFSWAGTRYAWTSPVILGLFAGSAAFLILFLLIERSAQNPVLPLSLFRTSIFSLSNAALFLIGFAMFGSIMYTPFFIQGVLGLSATHSSFLMMPMTLGMVLASTGSGQIVTRTGRYKWIALTGLVIMAFGVFSMTTLTENADNWQIAWRMLLIGIGLGSSFPIFNLTIQNAVDYRFLGVATSASQLFRQMGGTVGVSIMGTVMNTAIQSRMGTLMANIRHHLPAAARTPQMLKKIASLGNPQLLMDQAQLIQIRSRLPGSLIPVFDTIVSFSRGALTIAIHHVFFIAGLILLMAILIALLVREIPLRTSNAQAVEEDPDWQRKTA